MQKAIVRRKNEDKVDLRDVFEPDLDLVETHDYVRIVVELPGIHYDDVDVLIGIDSVIIRGQRNPHAIYHNDEEFRIIERKMGKFFRQVPITADVNQNETQLYYEDGVLVVHMPKRIYNN